MNSRRLLRIATQPIEELRCDLLGVYFFSDERPLRGGAGRVDWRLCGQFSEMIRNGEISGAAGERALVPGAGGLQTPRVLLIGLGECSAPPVRQSQFAIDEIASVARGLGLHTVALALPAAWLGPAFVPGLPAAFARSIEAVLCFDSSDLALEIFLDPGCGRDSRKAFIEAFRCSPHFCSTPMGHATESGASRPISSPIGFSSPTKL